MNKGFVPLLVVAIIGVVTLVAGGGAYGVYKYNQVVEDKQILTEKIDEQKDIEIQRLQEQVDLLGGGNNIDEVPEIAEDKLFTYYIKPETANIRPCTDVNDTACKPMGQYKQNDKLDLPFSSIEDMPEWVTFDWNSSVAYLNKIALSEKEISATSPMAQVSEVAGEDKTVKPGMVSTEPLIKVIDIIISNGREHVAYLEGIKEETIYYKELYEKSREVVRNLMEAERDSYLLKQYEDLNVTYTAIKTFNESMFAVFDPVIEATNKSITFQVQRKNSIPKYVTNEIYKVDAEILVDELETQTNAIELLLGSRTDFLKNLQVAQERVSEIQSNIDTYLAEGQNYSVQTYVQTHVPTVQPYISPFGPLTIPRKTYCTISGTGINGVSDIVCN